MYIVHAVVNTYYIYIHKHTSIHSLSIYSFISHEQQHHLITEHHTILIGDWSLGKAGFLRSSNWNFYHTPNDSTELSAIFMSEIVGACSIAMSLRKSQWKASFSSDLCELVSFRQDSIAFPCASRSLLPQIHLNSIIPYQLCIGISLSYNIYIHQNQGFVLPSLKLTYRLNIGHPRRKLVFPTIQEGKLKMMFMETGPFRERFSPPRCSNMSTLGITLMWVFKR